MGSTDDLSLPSSHSPALILTHPTEKERQDIWTSTYPEWGSALSPEVYVKREAYMQTIPMAKTGGISNWVLATSADPEDETRLVLASCETLRKRALIATASKETGTVEVREGIIHGIGSVFCDPKFRGHGYAGRMMAELGPALKHYPGSFNPATAGGGIKLGINLAVAAAVNGAKPSPTSPIFINEGKEKKTPQSAFSILYSDIGKQFYASRGWIPFPSAHVSFPPSTAYVDDISARGVTTLSYHDLAVLSALDEDMLLQRMSALEYRPSVAEEIQDVKKKVRVAIVPDLDSMLWHLMREDFMTTQLFSRTPTVRGALVGSDEHKNRVWAVWTRNYYSPDRKDMHRNKLFILRFVIENEDKMVAGAESGHAFLLDAVRKIIGAARREAAEWHVGEVQMWNPSPIIRELIEESGIEHSWIEREKDSIASLMWYGDGDGDGSVEDVEWVANEKYAWC